MINTILSGYASQFEEKLARAYHSGGTAYDGIYDACRYSLLLGGKRLRPFLLNSFYKLCGGCGDMSERFEIAIESIHTYSLIHDDLPCMDNDDMRRGKPSCHKRFGEEYALLAGDALLTAAFANAAASDSALGYNNIVRAISVLAECAGIDGMIGGQTVDLLFEEKKAGEATLELICRLKTGALIKAACTIGCILADADDERIQAAALYAEKLGLAFQIVDDILDETGSAEKLGKPIHSDRDNDKSTFVSLLGIEKCRAEVKRLTEEAKAALDLFGPDADSLKDLADLLCERDH